MMAPIIKTTYGTTPRTGHRSGQATPAPSPLPFYCGGGRHRLRWFLPSPPLSVSRTAKAAARHKSSARYTTGPAPQQQQQQQQQQQHTKPEPAAAANKTTTTTKISSSNTNYNHHHSHHHHHHHQQQQQQYEIKLFEASDLVIYKRQIV